MKQESINKLKLDLVNTYRKIGEDKALIYARKLTMTGNDVADAIEQETDIGLHIIDLIIGLAIDLVKRDKRNLD